jgi:hypothetical protein
MVNLVAVRGIAVPRIFTPGDRFIDFIFTLYEQRQLEHEHNTSITRIATIMTKNLQLLSNRICEFLANILK